jgi:RNA polymerase sigma factor (sigma-70 family)
MKTTTEIVHQNLGLVHKLSYRYQRNGISRKDLVQEGTLGLHRAIVKYDPARGTKLSTYAYPWIRSYMSRYVKKTQKAMDYLPVAEVCHVDVEEEDLGYLMECLSYNEMEVITQLYFNKTSLKDVSTMLGLSKIQVKRFEARALDKMRQRALK